MIGTDTPRTILGYHDALALYRSVKSNKILRDTYSMEWVVYETESSLQEVERVVGWSHKNLKICWLLSRMHGVKMRRKRCRVQQAVELLTVIFALEEMVSL